MPCFLRIRGRPFNILGGGGGGGGVFSTTKILSLVLQEKNNLALKRVKKNNLAWPERNKKISWLTIKEKSPFYLIFVRGRYIYMNSIYARHLLLLFSLKSITYLPHLIYKFYLFIKV